LQRREKEKSFSKQRQEDKWGEVGEKAGAAPLPCHRVDQGHVGDVDRSFDLSSSRLGGILRVGSDVFRDLQIAIFPPLEEHVQLRESWDTKGRVLVVESSIPCSFP
jgi:hypothetical protein